MDVLAALIGSLLGYGSIALATFSLAFVLAMTLKKRWPYWVALVLTVVFYALLFSGLNYGDRVT